MQKFRTLRVSLSVQVFGLRMCHPLKDVVPRGRLASAFTGRSFPIGCAHADDSARWRVGLMRYRSATAADFHGLP